MVSRPNCLLQDSTTMSLIDKMNELRPVLFWAGSARFTPVTTFIMILNPSVVLLTEKWILEGVFCPGTFIWSHLQPFIPKNRKNQFSGGKSAKKSLKTVHCAPDMF